MSTNIKSSYVDLFRSTNYVKFVNPTFVDENNAEDMKALDRSIPDFSGTISLPQGTLFKVVGLAKADTIINNKTKKSSHFLIITIEGHDKEYRIPAGQILTGFPPVESIIDSRYPNEDERLMIKSAAQKDGVWRPSNSPSNSYIDLLNKNLVSLGQFRKISKMTQESSTWKGGIIQVNMLAFKVLEQS